MRTEIWTATAEGTDAGDIGWNSIFVAGNGKQYTKVNAKHYKADANGTTSSEVQPGSFESGQKYFCTFDLETNAKIIEISANSFPGTYYVTGDTFARSAASGMDEFFQFIIPKAKVNAENTITLEAEGDPSTFNLSLKVLRPDDGVMMKLVQYDPEGGTNTTETTSAFYHNHNLLGENAQG